MPPAVCAGHRPWLPHFEALCAIPRVSGHTDAVASYLSDFAAARGLLFERDEADNVLIRLPAAPGYGTREPLTLQAHTDMVGAVQPGCTRDPARDGVRPVFEGDFVRAEGTSLGADDGFGVAFLLALAHNPSSCGHPPLDLLFTSNEEIGMLGAAAFDVSRLRCARLINLDSDVQGVFTVGCAGGARVDLSMPLTRVPVHASYVFRVEVGALTGGHSGTQIHRGGANALKLLGRALCALHAHIPFRLCDIRGGSADNAIAREGSALLCAKTDLRPEFDRICKQLLSNIQNTDPNAAITCTLTDVPVSDGIAQTRELLHLLDRMPAGVLRYDDELPDVVQTSLNPGVACVCADTFRLSFCVRSCVDKEKERVCEALAHLAQEVGALCSVHGSYHAWQVRPVSPLRDVLTRTYAALFDAPARTEVIHAGVECGIFAGKLAEFDAVSIGADIFDIHTPNERMSLTSADQVWRFLLAALAVL